MIQNKSILTKDFLKVLFNNGYTHERYVKLILLDFNEQPLEEIQGKVQNGGSISIDGQSAVRRTCSLTFLTDSITKLDYNWTTKSKIELYIGIKNNTQYTEYSDIIWFKQGIFVISSFNQSIRANNSVISIQGKDKMCLLNGEFGGQIGAYFNFGAEIVNDQEQGVLLKHIIFNLLHIYGHELEKNIIINDVADQALEQIAYQGKDPFYLLGKVFGNQPLSSAGGKISQFEIIGDEEKKNNLIDSWGEDYDHDNFVYYSLSPLASNTELNYYKTEEVVDSITGKKDNVFYYIIKLFNGDILGVRQTSLVFPGWEQKSLESVPTDHVQNILDKIVKAFPSYEYFYDVEGRFIFQEKKDYLLTSFAPYEKNSGIEVFMDNNQYSWEFNDGEMIQDFRSTPNLNNLKNDFSVWGLQTDASGQQKQIHLRYLIAKKPESYIRTDDPSVKLTASDQLDWRELIWQMADDWSHNNGKGALFYSRLKQLNPWVQNGQTGYENLYSDILLWREFLYDYNVETHTGFWKQDVLEHPEKLVFWLEILEGSSALSQYRISNIGHRTKVINDDDAKVIMIRRSVNSLILRENEKSSDIFQQYPILIWPEAYDYLIKPAGGQKSLQNLVDNALYNNTYCIEQVSFTLVPNYYIQPNTLIHIADNKTNIFGDYIVNKIMIPLTSNGLMTISAIRYENKIQ